MGLIINTNGSGYTTATKVRSTYGFSQTTDISDADLNSLIVYASRQLHRDISTRFWNVRLVGSIDGATTTYATPHGYLADRNLDSVVNAQDVTVYGVKRNTDGTLTRTTLTVSAVDAFGGKLTLSSAPTTSAYDWLEADYESYGVPVYSDMLEAAANALSAHLVYLRARDPAKVTLAQLKGGSLGPESLDAAVAFSTGSRFLHEYRAIVSLIKAKKIRAANDPKPGDA